MICPKCGIIMVIDEWGGWRWTCFYCDYIGREATDKECEAQQNEFKRMVGKMKKTKKERIRNEWTK
jgi:hypothetical protein